MTTCNEDSQAQKSFIYTITLSSNTTPVCKASFLSLHGIKESRLKRKVFNFEKNITDGRGHHHNHPTVGKDVKEAVRSHIIDFPARESYYSRIKNKHKKYLYSSLTLAKMHRLFLLQHPDLTSLCKYSMYSDIFNYEFNIAFGYPRSDICDLCERHQIAIKAVAANSNLAAKHKLKVEHELHIRK